MTTESLTELLNTYATNLIKVRVTFESGNTKWGWIHLYNNRYYLTRGRRVGYAMDTAVKIEAINK